MTKFLDKTSKKYKKATTGDGIIIQNNSTTKAAVQIHMDTKLDNIHLEAFLCTPPPPPPPTGTNLYTFWTW